MIPFFINIWQSVVTAIACWFTFNGTNEYMTIPNDASLSFDRLDSCSFSFWMKQDSGANKMIMSKQQNTPNYRGYSIIKINGDIALLWRNDNSPSNQIVFYTNTTTLSNDVWYNVVVTYDGSSDISGLNVYINGLLQAKKNTVNTLSGTLINTEPLQIGARGGAFNFDGDLDEIQIWKSTLSASDALDIYNLGRVDPDISTITGYNTNCISHYRLGTNDTFGGSNWTIYDEIRNNDGTSVNMDVTNKVCDND